MHLCMRWNWKLCRSTRQKKSSRDCVQCGTREKEWNKVDAKYTYTPSYMTVNMLFFSLFWLVCLFAIKFVISISTGPCKWYTNRCAENLNTCIAKIEMKRSQMHREWNKREAHEVESSLCSYTLNEKDAFISVQILLFWYVYVYVRVPAIVWVCSIRMCVNI